MATFREILIDAETELLGADLFFGHGYESAHDEAVALVLAAADCSLVDTSASILDTHYPKTAAPKRRHQAVPKRRYRVGGAKTAAPRRRHQDGGTKTAAPRR